MQLARILVAALLLAGAACRNTEPDGGRVLLIGIDGATLRVIEPLLEQGRLPHLAALANAGTYGPLRSERPLRSPAIWTSIATGKKREKHGIDGFVRNDKGRSRLFRSSDRRSHALWNIASDAGLKVGVVNWWVTFPVEHVSGVMVSDHAIPGQLEARASLHSASVPQGGAIVHPAEWQTQIEVLGGDLSSLSGLPDPFAAEPDSVAYLWQSLLGDQPGKDARITRIASRVDERTRPDLLMVFLKGIDPVSHTLFGYIDPVKIPEGRRPGGEALRAGRDALFRYYEYTDGLIGHLIRGFGPDDLVLIVSDHGFEAGPTESNKILTGLHTSSAAQDGILFARGPGIEAGSKASSMTIYDITPTILAWLGLPVGDDMDGAVASFLERPDSGRVATHDAEAIGRADGRPSGADEDILEDLRALGYIE